jgi:multidrug efflux pump subunit AcrB
MRRALAAARAMSTRGAAPGAALLGVAWPATFPLSPRDLSRADEGADGLFYAAPRFVHHIDAAAVDVQSALFRAQRSLPTEMTEPPSYRKVNPADAPVLLISLRSPSLPQSELQEYAEHLISPTLSTIEGVAQVNIYGAKRFAVRVRVDPAALAARNIGLDELSAALKAANVNTPAGTFEGPQQTLVLQANKQMSSAREFADLIISNKGGVPVRLRDVARVQDSVEVIKSWATLNGENSITLAIQRQPGANTVKVVDAVSNENQDLPVGSIRSIQQDRVVQVQGRMKRPEDFGNIIVARKAGSIVRLSQVARVNDGAQELENLALYNGERTLLLSVQKSQDDNTIEVVDGLMKTVNELQTQFPPGVKLKNIYDGSRQIRVGVNNVRKTLIEGSLLTVLIVFLFLNSWRSTIITGLTLPIAIISTFWFMGMLGFTINMITLMALSLCIGLLIEI